MIATPLTQQVTEDNVLILDIEASDPNGETLTLVLRAAPEHGEAVLSNTTTATSISPPAVSSTPPSSTSGKATLHAEAHILKGVAAAKKAGQTTLVGRIRYTPATNFNGTDRFGFAVRNASGFESEAEVVVTIQAAPDAPQVISPIPTQTLDVGGLPFSIDLNTVFSDTDGEPLTYETSSSDTNIVAPTMNGSVLVVAARNRGTATVSATATDPAGLTALTTFSVTGGGNRCPLRIGAVGAQVLDVGAPPFEVDDLNALFSDPDGDALTFTALSTAPGIAAATIEGSRLVVIKTSLGTAAISVIARDAVCSADEPLSFTVTDTSGPEVADPIDDLSQRVGDSFAVDLNTVFRDPAGGTLTFEAQTQVEGVVQAVVTGQTLTVTALAGGQTSITVTATKPDGRTIADSFTVTVSENRPPIVNDDAYAIDQGQTLTVNAAQGVLANDTDPDGDAFTAVLAATPSHGTLTLDANGSFVYTHDGSGTSNDTFTYQATDGDKTSSVATVTLTIRTLNQPPQVTNPGTRSNGEGEAIFLQIQATDTSPLTYSATNLPPNLTIHPQTGLISGTLSTTAATNSPYTVTVTVTDSQGAKTTVTFFWTVTNPPPQVTNPGPQVNTEEEAVSLQVQATDDDTIRYSATDLPPGLAIDADTGLISGTIDSAAAEGSIYFVIIRVTDAQDAVTSIVFLWTVNPRHPTPTLAGLNPTSGARGATLDVTLTGTDFIDGISSVAFSGSGITLNTTSVDSSTQITVNITINALASVGTRQVTVSNTGPGGGTSQPQSFTVTF